MSTSEPNPNGVDGRVSSLVRPAGKKTFNAGARPQRPLWASVGTKGPKVHDVLSSKAPAAPFTANTIS